MKKITFYAYLVGLLLISSHAAGEITFSYPVDENLYYSGLYAGRSFYYDSIHIGEDINLPAGTPIRAIANGRIVQYEYHSGYATSDDGTSIAAVIEHDLGEIAHFILEKGHEKRISTDKICSIYGHIRKSEEYNGPRLDWEIGQNVNRGDIIGYVNDDAYNGDGSEHLHMGIRLSGHPGSWAYFGYENVNDYPLSNVIYFGALSEIIEVLNKPRYIFTTIDPPGSTDTIVFGINDDGIVSGTFFDQDSNDHGFLYTGFYITLDYPGALRTRAYGINNAGEIVGRYYDSSSVLHGFIYNGLFSTFDFPTSIGSGLYGINDIGAIVGFYWDDITFTNRGFKYYNGSFSTIDYPGAAHTLPFGINNFDEIGGYYVDSNGSIHGFLSFFPGVFLNFDIPDGTRSHCYGINDLTNFVGWYYDSELKSRAYLYDGVFSSIIPPGSVREAAYDINEHKQIVGYYFDADGLRHGFIATPISFYSDFDTDKDIDGLDLSNFSQAYSNNYPDADINKDGLINTEDVDSFAQYFGGL